ncbi:MAG: 6-phosphogluconolactonase [Litorimonas sp.]
MPSLDIKLFKDKAALVQAATTHLSTVLDDALEARGRASAMLSGGSSPKPIYEALANRPLAWDGVGISLVDERWVPSGVPGSNADFIRDCFSGTPAESAFFVPLYNGDASPDAGLAAAEQALALIAQPFDLCVLGMGMDGHTASWFPYSGGLVAALDMENTDTLAAIDATGCAVAGDHTDRITLTLSAVSACRNIILLLPSAEKLSVFKAAAKQDILEAPVKALHALKNRLTVYALEGTQ